MSKNNIPKSIKRKIKELSIRAYEKELGIQLEKLYNEFEEWKNERLSSGELSNLIHEYDRGPSKEMYIYYNTVDPDMAVGRAVALDYFSQEEIPAEVYPFISNSIEFYKKQYDQ